MRNRKRLAIALILAGGGALISKPGFALDLVRGDSHDSKIPSATLHFGVGREAKSFQLKQPQGVILLYRISAPIGMKIRGFAQLPSVTVPLRISTSAPGAESPCVYRGTRLVCTQGEEGCPMPAGTWHFRLEKLGGREGEVTLWFRVDRPLGQA